MSTLEALEAVAQHRGERIVIPTMTSVGVWPQLSDGPLDFHYLPSSMGQAVPLALGLTIAQSRRGAIVLSGDGGLLMNLGCIVTLAQYSVPVWVILFDNGLYSVTGGQAVPNAGRTDFAGLARAAGLPRVYEFATADLWHAAAAEVFAGSGPVFVWLKVQGETGQKTPAAPRPMAAQIARLQAAL
jgi:sulfopyruvate decarboxylase subunit beta